VLFDVDGTLVDSNDAHARAWVDVLTAFGYPVELPRVQRMIGMGGDKIVAALTDLEPDGSRAKALLSARQARFLKHYLPSVRSFSGARVLFERLRSDGIQTAIASSATPEELSPLLKRAGVDDLIVEQASSNDAQESKPAPDIVRAALTRLKLAPKETVMIGDTPFDAEACRRAEVPLIAVQSGGWSAPDFAGALAVFRDVNDILEHYDTLFV
jgi:phosphoglycolate phosphatase-like HAD superfamily hydrolase